MTSSLFISTYSTTEDVFFEWLRDGVVVDSRNSTNLRLIIPDVDFNHMGIYSCRITLPDRSVIGPVEAGELIVLGEYLHVTKFKFVVHIDLIHCMGCTHMIKS